MLGIQSNMFIRRFHNLTGKIQNFAVLKFPSCSQHNFDVTDLTNVMSYGYIEKLMNKNFIFEVVNSIKFFHHT